MSEAQFHIYRKGAFAGAILPYRMYVNGRYIGTIYNGKSLDAAVPKADAYYMEDGILSLQNAVIKENGLSEYSIVMKRAGGWRTESYNEFYIDKGKTLEKLPSFHWERLFKLRQSMPQSARLLALCFEFWMSAADDLQEVFASEHLFESLAALQTIGAHEYHDLLLGVMKDDFCNARFPLDDDQIEQMQPEIEDVNRSFWNNKSAEAAFHEAVAKLLIAKPNDPDLIF